jgi:uncharacterized protein YndB with AHSA1/START domain
VIEPLEIAFDVECSVEHAFATFAERFSLWWPRSHSVTRADGLEVVFEPRVGGRIYERTPDGEEHDWGEVLACEPPARLVYLWHLRFDRADATEVEVTFTAASVSLTHVRIVHTGWERLGAAGPERRDRNRQGWAGVLGHYRAAIGSAYDRFGGTYTASRRPDPRIAGAIRDALGTDVRSVVNVGAGSGAYEPADLDVVAVEPSEVMNGQRPGGADEVVRATAEALPFADDSFDAAMAIFSDHHWTDRAAGLGELRRVARRRVVLLNVDPSLSGAFWLSQEYLPGVTGRLVPPRYREPGFWEAELRALVGELELRVVPVPHDCSDGFYGAFWRRPHAYLDPAVRANISVFRLLPDDEVERAVAALATDLDSGAWQERHADLLGLDALDLGYRLVVATPG